MPKTYKATQLQDRDAVQNLKEEDIIRHGSFVVQVDAITCAMGGDFCIEGTVKSWSYDHQYDVKYGEKIFWGPKRLVKGNLYDYLNAKNVIGMKDKT